MKWSRSSQSHCKKEVLIVIYLLDCSDESQIICWSPSSKIFIHLRILQRIQKWWQINYPTTIHSNSFTPRPSYNEIICHSNSKSVDETLWCNFSNEISLTQLLHKVLFYKEKFEFFKNLFFGHYLSENFTFINRFSIRKYKLYKKAWEFPPLRTLTRNL